MFRLEKVLHWKETLEREARIRRSEIERRVELVQREIDGTRERRERAPDENADVEELAEWSRYLESLRRIEGRLVCRLEELLVVRDEREKEHMALRRDVKGLERLQVKEAERACLRRARLAQEHMDDVAGRKRMPLAGNSDRLVRSIQVRNTREGAAP